MVKNNKFIIIPALMIFGSLGIFSSCSNSNNEGFDNTTYNLSKTNNDEVTAAINKINGGYKVTLSGKGEIKDFSNEVKVPWYSIASKVKDVEINEGITSLGSELFSKVKKNYYILPSSINSITDTTFIKNTTLYSYASSVNNIEEYKFYSY